MTKEQLEKEARKLYRSVYAACIGNGYTHNDAGIEANEAYISFFDRFQSHITETQPEPAENPNKLPEFVPDWSKLVYNTCAQDQSGGAWNYQAEPYFDEIEQEWVAVRGTKVKFIGDFAPPADFTKAIWQRPTE